MVEREPRMNRMGRPAFVLVAILAPVVVGCGATISTDPDPEGGVPTLDSDDPTTPRPEPPADAVELPSQEIETLFSAAYSGLDDSHRELLRSDGAWSALWADLNGRVSPTPPQPAVDFSTRNVLVVAMGSRPTGGYSIEVTSLSVARDTLFVGVRETSPGIGCLTTQALSQPAMALSVPAFDGTVAFLEERVVTNCM